MSASTAATSPPLFFGKILPESDREKGLAKFTKEFIFFK